MGGYPAKATAGGDGLGEGIEPHDTALRVDGEVRGNKGVEEGEAGGLRCVVVLSLARGIVVGVARRILEVPIWIIFDDDDVVFDADGVYIFAALDAQGA